MMVLEPRPPSPPQADCVCLGHIAAETSNNANDPGNFSWSVKKRDDSQTHETFREVGLMYSTENGN